MADGIDELVDRLIVGQLARERQGLAGQWASWPVDEDEAREAGAGQRDAGHYLARRAYPEERP